MKTYSIIIKDSLNDFIIKLYLIKCDNIKEALLRTCPILFDKTKKKPRNIKFIGSNLKTYLNIDEIIEDESYLSFVYNTDYLEAYIYPFDNIKKDCINGNESLYSFKFEIKEITDKIINTLKNNYNQLIKDPDKLILILLHLFELEYINL